MDILNRLYDQVKYNIDNYKYIEYNDLISLDESISMFGLAILVGNYKFNTNYEELDKFLINNRNELVHLKEQTKNVEYIEKRLRNLIEDFSEIIIYLIEKERWI